jgi:hypothetical protein
MDSAMIKAFEIRERYEKIWMALENVTAVGTGMTSDGRTGIIISMEKDDIVTKNIFPPEIEGVPVELRISGNIDAGSG